MFNISIRAYLENNVCWTFVLVNSQSSEQHGFRNLCHINSFSGGGGAAAHLWWLEYTTNELLPRILQWDPWAKKSPVMTSLSPHHPTHSLSVVGDSLAGYLFLTCFSNSNPYPHYFPSNIRTIYMYAQNNYTKVHFTSIIVKVIHRPRENHEWLSSH